MQYERDWGMRYRNGTMWCVYGLWIAPKSKSKLGVLSNAKRWRGWEPSFFHAWSCATMHDVYGQERSGNEQGALGGDDSAASNGLLRVILADAQRLSQRHVSE